VICCCFIFQLIIEKCTYTPAESDKSETICNKETWISSRVPGFSRIISSFGASRFKKNARRAEIGFEYVLNKLYVPETNKRHGVLEQRIKEEFGKDWKEELKLRKNKNNILCDSVWVDSVCVLVCVCVLTIA